ncbi:hypothetical protein [Nonomuraea sp. NPDC052265]|uniref:hypothetical protein n=1 Tax=Nonomuraea sp. NPDC052265 TaxID=3364374 RepID=UPI0037C98327
MTAPAAREPLRRVRRDVAASPFIRDRPLTEIYRSSPLFTALRDPDRLGGRCGACEFRTICGGSRSRAYACSGDVLGEEPWYAYEPGSFPYQKEPAAHV